MPCSKITNNSNFEVDKHKPMFDSFFPYSQKTLGFDKPFSLNFASDQENSANPLGKTAYYDHSSSEITIYIDGRHIKDIMRSISHELVHHAQNCRGEFDGTTSTDPGYAQTDDHLREMEREAYEKGNLCFRDWEDQYKQLKENKMAKLAKEEIKKLLKEASIPGVFANKKHKKAWCGKHCKNLGMNSGGPSSSANRCGCTEKIASKPVAQKTAGKGKSMVYTVNQKIAAILYALPNMKDGEGAMKAVRAKDSKYRDEMFRQALKTKKGKEWAAKVAKSGGLSNMFAQAGTAADKAGAYGKAVAARRPLASKGPRWRPCKKVIKRNCEGDNVTVIQRKLQDLGFYKKPLDKKFGGGTRAAVIAFQKDNSLEPDGAVGNNTIKVLDKVWRAARTARKSVATSAAQPLSTNTARPAAMAESVDFSQKHLEPIRERFITIYKRLLRNK